MTPLELGLFVSQLITAIGILGYHAWRTDKMRRKQAIADLARQAELDEDLRRHREAQLPDGCTYVNQNGIPLEGRELLNGPVMLVGVGTPAVQNVLRTCIRCAEMHLENLIGSILVVDLDASLRIRFSNKLPAVFKDRVVATAAPTLEPGFGGRDPMQVKGYLDRYGPYLYNAVEEVTKLHLKRTTMRPNQILPQYSNGGHAYLCVLVTDLLRERYPETDLIAHIDLPMETDYRANFGVIKPLAERCGLAGWTLSDALSADYITNDTAVVDLSIGALVAALQSGQPVRLNNIYRLALPKEPGGVLAYQYAYGTLPAKEFQPCHCGCLPSRFFVQKDHLCEEVKGLLRAIDQGRATSSLAAPLGQPGRSVFDLILAAVGPEDLQDLEDHLKLASDLEARYQDDEAPGGVTYRRENYRRLFASFSPPIDAADPQCQFAVIRLIAVSHGPQALPELVKVPRERLLTEGV